MEKLFDFCYIAVNSAIILTILNYNINIYKLNKRDLIELALSVIIGCVVIGKFSVMLESIYVYCISIFFIYRKSRKLLQSIILDALYIILAVLCDSIIGTIIVDFLGINVQLYTLKYLLVCIAIDILLILVSRLVGKTIKNYGNFIMQNYKSKYAILIYVTLVITAIMFYLNINWNSTNDANYLTKVNGIVFIAYSFILLFTCVILAMSIKKETSYQAKQIQLEQLQEYTNNLEQLYMDMRKFRHDYINILSSMAGFMEEENIKGLQEYFDNHIYPLNDKINSNNYKLGLLKNIKITEIKGLIATKLIRAQELGVDINIDITEEITEIDMDIIDLVRCLGILLDNAIEAAIKSKEKIVNLGMINKGKSVIILIINSCENNIGPIAQLFKEGYSTKGNGRGLGLSTFKNTIDTYSNIVVDTEIENNKFVQCLNIKNTKMEIA
ncbi:sensor histidine kinase [uncultured Clostridium sp.]|uniref:sensor histidine kinase n=2 Tax=uncultured Clostridium sp. TaxID=59620 RepID=UPI0025E2D6F6|nr:GHKL domain-containing protein [uncultured Clostridium sp.]